MRLIQALGVALNVESGEGRLTWLLFAHAFFRGMIKAFVRISAFTLFLSAFEITLLPLVYVGTAFAGTFVTLNYLKLERRLSLNGLLTANLAITSICLTVFAFALPLTDGKWIAFVLPIVGEIIIGLINTELASLNAQVLTVRQGKRLLGLVGSGEFLAQIGVGLSTVLLVAVIGSSNLLLLAALSSVAALVVVRRIFSEANLGLSGPADNQQAETVNNESISLLAMVQNPYVFLLFASYSLFIMAYYLVDSAFYFEISARFSSDEEIAVFLGEFSALYGVLALVCLTFLSGNVLRRYGLLVGMLILPTGMAAGVLAVIFTVAFDAPIALIFWFVALTQLMRFVLSNAFSRPCRNILTYALPVRQRSWVLATLFGIVDPVSTGVAGLFLWLLMHWLGYGSIELFYVAAVVLILWIFILFPTYRQYLHSLTGSLARRQLDGAVLDLHDHSTISIVRHGLSSEYPAEVIYCLNLLEEMQYEALEQTLHGMLKHPEVDVRKEVLRKLRKSESSTSVEPVSDFIAGENDAEVLGEAVKTLARLGETDAVEKIAPFLDHPESRVRLGAMVGLLKNGGIEGVLIAGNRFLDLTKSPEPGDRAYAARVCGEIATTSFCKPLLGLLQDQDLGVRELAIAASGRFTSDNLLQAVAAHLSAPRLGAKAGAALIARAEDSLETLQTLFDDNEQSTDTRARVARILGRIGGEKATRMLVSKIEAKDKSLRLAIFNALASCRYQASTNESRMIDTLLEQEVRDAAWVCAALLQLEDRQETELLSRAMELELARGRDRVLLLLSFLYSQETILRCKLYLSDPSVEKRDYALEVIDNLIPIQAREMLFPLLEDLALHERNNRLASQFADYDLCAEEWIEQIAAGTGDPVLPWTRSCALYTLGCSPGPASEAIAIAALSSSNALVRETAVWMLGKIKPQRHRDQLEVMLDDAEPQVAEMARSVLQAIS